MHLSPGSSATAELLVGTSDLASAFILEDGDSFPPVFATARMIALMETAAARAMQGVLGDGELSVGVSVDVQHTAATPAGDSVIAMARFIGLEDDRFYRFEVSAHDSAGEIGRGFHKRAVVATERLMAGAKKRGKH